MTLITRGDVKYAKLALQQVQLLCSVDTARDVTTLAETFENLGELYRATGDIAEAEAF